MKAQTNREIVEKNFSPAINFHSCLPIWNQTVEWREIVLSLCSFTQREERKISFYETRGKFNKLGQLEPLEKRLSHFESRFRDFSCNSQRTIRVRNSREKSCLTCTDVTACSVLPLAITSDTNSISFLCSPWRATLAVIFYSKHKQSIGKLDHAEDDLYWFISW